MADLPGSYSGASNEGGDLEHLFARLRNSSSNSMNAQTAAANPSGPFQGFTQPGPYFGQHGQHSQQYQPFVSSPMATPPAPSQQPPSGSAIMSPNVSIPPPRQMASTGGSLNAGTSLLDLLNLGRSSALSPSQQTSVNASRTHPSFGSQNSYNQSAPSAAAPPNNQTVDLLAALMGNRSRHVSQQSVPQVQSPVPAQAPKSSEFRGPPPESTQSYLLSLLQQPKPSQNGAAPQLEKLKAQSPAGSMERAEAEEPEAVEEQKTVDQRAAEFEKLARSLEATKIMEATEIGEGARSEQENTKPSSRGGPVFTEAQSSPRVPSGLFTYVNPFEQLAASSPRNQTPQPSTRQPPPVQILRHPRTTETGDNKRKVGEHTPNASPLPAPSRRKLDSYSPSVQSSLPPSPLPDGRTQIEALMGIGATRNKETVSEALNEVGEQVDKQVEQALAQATEKETAPATEEPERAAIEQDLKDLLAAKTEAEFEDSARTTAIGLQKELEKGENANVLHDSLPTPVAEAVKELVDDTAQGNIVDSWESADAEESVAPEQRYIKVYNFPLRPWVSLTLVGPDMSTLAEVREESTMDIAKLKKPFDQVDRNLVTATSNFIIWGMSKNGGLRVITQEDGKDAKIFSHTGDRIFNVNVSTSMTDLTETVIGTGTSGTVYWATLREASGEFVEGTNVQQHGFALPPIQAGDNESAGGVLKTRARKSCTHPDFFAVGRGKTIHIIWPAVILKQGLLKPGPERLVDTEKYLNSRTLKINTGKAGKDFTFSQDDTAIVSLDKAGKVKIWDVRTLVSTSRNGEFNYPTPEQISPIEITEPLMTLDTNFPDSTAKSWPTSVMLVDKQRPYQKGGALRYLIVGMKQNHCLQLWDLSLGRAVQEINFPHDSESDAICSVAYQPFTGMLIVGHPTRNSVYYVHLSAPKYNLSRSLTQAEFIEKVSRGDGSIPKPDSTAVFSGMREATLSNRGQLRSLDVLSNPPVHANDTDPSLYDVYFMHDQGVSCISVKKEDLGWAEDNKVQNPIDAEALGLVRVVEHEAPATASEAAVEAITGTPSMRTTFSSTNSAISNAVSRKRMSMKKDHPDQRLADIEKSSVTNGAQDSPSGTDRTETRRKKRASPAKSTPSRRSVAEKAPTTNGPISTPAVSTAAATALPASDQASVASQTPTRFMEVAAEATEKVQEHRSQSSLPVGMSQANIDDIVKAVEGGMSKGLEQLYKRFDDDKRALNAAGEARQEAILRLTSTTLSENLQGVLSDTVTSTIQKHAVPAVTEAAMKAVTEQLGNKLNVHLNKLIPKHIESSLPAAITKSLQKPEVHKQMSESIAKNMGNVVEKQFKDALVNTIMPTFTSLTVQTAQKISADIHRQASDQIQALEQQHIADNRKIDQLTNLVKGMAGTMTSMAENQAKFQDEFMKWQRQSARDRQASNQSRQIENSRTVSGSSAPKTSRAATPPKTEEQLQLERVLTDIDSDVGEGNFEGACMRWLQAVQPQEIFESYFSRIDPSIMQQCNPILQLSIAGTVSGKMDGEFVLQRLSWLEVILSTFLTHIEELEPAVREVTPRIMQKIVQKGEHLFMGVSSRTHGQNPFLRRLSQMVAMANQIISSV